MEDNLKRMNFLKKGRWAFTYLTMVKILVVWCLFLLLLYGFQSLSQRRIVNKISESKEIVSKLNTEREQLIKEMEKYNVKRMGIKGKSSLTMIIIGRPHWSAVLDGLVKNLSSKIWLNSLEASANPDDVYEVKVLGSAKSQRAITNFIMKIDSSKRFTGTTLRGSELVGNVFKYEIATYPVVIGDL